MFNLKFDKTMKEVKQAIEEQQQDVMVVDVREVDEFEQGHIPQAYLLPVGELEIRARAELPMDKKLYVYCRSGQRSSAACCILKELGFDAYNVGGIVHWPYDVETGA